MNRPIDRLRNALQTILITDNNYVETEETQIDRVIDNVSSWLIRRVIPLLLITLIVNLTTMFTVPIDIAASKWFWIKDPLSFVIAVSIYHRYHIHTN